MAARRYRWVCPSCQGAKLASSRPKKLATVRFCLPCSEKTGELVERVCPVLDQQREAKAEAAKAKAKRATAAKRRRRQVQKAKRQADAESRFHYGTFDLRVELKRLCAFARKAGYAHRTPAMFVQWRHQGSYTTGYSSSHRRRIHLTIPKDSPAAPALSVLAHEIAHQATPKDRGHGDEWRWVFREIVAQAYGPVEHEPGCNKYELHRAVTRSIAKALGEELTDKQLELDEGEDAPLQEEE